MQYSFGSGILFGRSIESNTPTPVRFGALQGVNLDIAFTTKELYGQFQFPLALARGTAKITGKADFAQLNAQALNDLFFGLSAPSDNIDVVAVAEAQTITANAVTVTHNSTFSQDLGVTRASDGVIFQRVANSPAALEYTCNESTGVYDFNATDDNTPVRISYSYAVANGGKGIEITNQLLGASPQFSAVFTEVYRGKKMTVVLNACMSSKLTLPTKLEDFTIMSFDFQAFADASDVVGNIYLDE